MHHPLASRMKTPKYDASYHVYTPSHPMKSHGLCEFCHGHESHSPTVMSSRQTLRKGTTTITRWSVVADARLRPHVFDTQTASIVHHAIRIKARRIGWNVKHEQSCRYASARIVAFVTFPVCSSAYRIAVPFRSRSTTGASAPDVAFGKLSACAPEIRRSKSSDSSCVYSPGSSGSSTTTAAAPDSAASRCAAIRTEQPPSTAGTPSRSTPHSSWGTPISSTTLPAQLALPQPPVVSLAGSTTSSVSSAHDVFE